MTLQNFIYLLFGLIWLSGLIWASVIAFKKQKGETMRCDICGKRMRRGGTKIYDNDVLIGYYHRHCRGIRWFSKAKNEPLNVDSGPMNARNLGRKANDLGRKNDTGQCQKV